MLHDSVDILDCLPVNTLSVLALATVFSLAVFVSAAKSGVSAGEFDVDILVGGVHQPIQCHLG